MGTQTRTPEQRSAPYRGAPHYLVLSTCQRPLPLWRQSELAALTPLDWEGYSLLSPSTAPLGESDKD